MALGLFAIFVIIFSISGTGSSAAEKPAPERARHDTSTDCCQGQPYNSFAVNRKNTAATTGNQNNRRPSWQKRALKWPHLRLRARQQWPPRTVQKRRFRAPALQKDIKLSRLLQILLCLGSHSYNLRCYNTMARDRTGWRLKQKASLALLGIRRTFVECCLPCNFIHSW